MRKQIYTQQPSTVRRNPQEVSSKKNNPETRRRYNYTDADLGEDILELSVAPIPANANKFLENIYSTN